MRYYFRPSSSSSALLSHSTQIYDFMRPAIAVLHGTPMFAKMANSAETTIGLAPASRDEYYQKPGWWDKIPSLQEEKGIWRGNWLS
jgi:hypothetical protein